MIALVTSSSARELDTDLPHLLDHLGSDAEVVAWDDPSVDWTGFDLVVLRSTWDYHVRLAEFTAWLDATATVADVRNAPAMVRWNLDKRHLGELAAAGVAVVDTSFVDARTGIAADARDWLGTDVVIKPSVGAGSVGVERFRSQPEAALAHVERIVASGRVALVQPYAGAVDRLGETGLVFLGGELSHAFSKAAILATEVVWEGGLYASERIEPAVATAEQIAIARAALDVVERRFGETPLYARVDLVPGVDGPRVLEVELTEPSLFLHTDPGAAARAAAVFEAARP